MHRTTLAHDTDLEAAVLQYARAVQRAGAHNDLLRLHHHLPHDLVLLGTIQSTALAPARPRPSHTDRLLAVLGVEQDPLHIEALHELRSRLRRVREPPIDGTLLLAAPAPERAVALGVRAAPRVLRDLLGAPAEPPRAVQQGLVAAVRRKVLVHAHLCAHAVQRVLEGLGREEVEPAVLGPLAAHEALRLQARAPVDGPAAAEAAARHDEHRVVVGRDGAGALDHVQQVRRRVHGQVRRRVVVALVEHEHAVAGLGEGLGAHARAAAGADDYNVGVDHLGRDGALGLAPGGGCWCCWELEELVRIRGRWSPADGCGREADQPEVVGVAGCEDYLGQRGELPEEPAEVIDGARPPFVEDLTTLLDVHFRNRRQLSRQEYSQWSASRFTSASQSHRKGGGWLSGLVKSSHTCSKPIAPAIARRSSRWEAGAACPAGAAGRVYPLRASRQGSSPNLRATSGRVLPYHS